MQQLAEIYLEPWWTHIATDEIDRFFAQNTLDTALESPLDPDWAGFVRTLSRISATYAKAGNSERALEVAHSIESERGQALALQGVAEALAKDGKINNAMEVAGSIDDPELSVRAMVAIGRTIVGGTLIGDNLEVTAIAVLREALRVALPALEESTSFLRRPNLI